MIHIGKGKHNLKHHNNVLKFQDGVNGGDTKLFFDVPKNFHHESILTVPSPRSDVYVLEKQ